MTGKDEKNDLNQELPDEHEAVRHSLRESLDEPQRRKTVVTNDTGAEKPASHRREHANSSSGAGTGKNEGPR